MKFNLLCRYNFYCMLISIGMVILCIAFNLFWIATLVNVVAAALNLWALIMTYRQFKKDKIEMLLSSMLNRPRVQ